MSKLPASLANCKTLIQIPLIAHPSGVYMLVREGVVIYIGQSRNPMQRVLAHYGHINDGISIAFDSAYFIPVPFEDLNVLEGALIMLFRPERNGRTSLGNMVAPTASKEAYAEAISKYYGEYEMEQTPEEAAA